MPLNPVDFSPNAIWKCQTCGHTSTFDSINKLVNYFLEKIKNPRVFNSVEALEDMLEKSARLLHPNHYVVTLVRIKMNVAYIDLTHRMFGEGGEYSDEQEPAEVYMRFECTFVCISLETRIHYLAVVFILGPKMIGTLIYCFHYTSNL